MGMYGSEEKQFVPRKNASMIVRGSTGSFLLPIAHAPAGWLRESTANRKLLHTTVTASCPQPRSGARRTFENPGDFHIIEGA
jgi:hypothetical protein